MFAVLCISFRVSATQLKVFDQNNPAVSGYELVFDDEFNSLSSIDINATGGPGFNWYTKQFFTSPSSNTFSKINVSNGILTLNSTVSSVRNSNIATAAPANNQKGWVGKVFGGGAYFEARISFDPTTINPANGWPSFWAMAIEHMALKGADQWVGQDVRYSHFIEDDFFEYDTESFAGSNTYGAAMHDWFGIYKRTCPKGFCNINNTAGGGSVFQNAVIKVPSKTDWTQYHTIGQLWVPGSANKGTGYMQNYFDGLLVSTVTWIDSGAGVPPPTGSFAFSIADQNSLVIILGTGINQPLHVDWVHVWQTPSAAAISGNKIIELAR